MKADDSWCRSLTGRSVGDYDLVGFVGAGKIGYVYRAIRRNLPDCQWAVKLTFDRLKPGWEVELKKVASLMLVEGVVHFHNLGTETITHEKTSRLAQYTVWDYNFATISSPMVVAGNPRREPCPVDFARLVLYLPFRG